MKRFALFGGLFLTIGVGVLLATMPLSFVLERSALSERGFSWVLAQGTVWNGRVSGLYRSTQSLGDVQMGLRAGDLLSGKISYDVDLNSSAVRGTSLIDIKSASRLRARQMNLDVSLSALNGLDTRIRDVGGWLHVQDADILFNQNGCQEASGTVRSDIVTNMAAAFGQVWPEASGEIRCESGWVLMSMTATGPLGEEFMARGRIGPGPASLEARVDNAGQELGYGLAMAGFVPDGAGFAYRQKKQEEQTAP